MIRELIIQLKDKRSAKRRAAAKKIRKSKDSSYEKYLFEALRLEVKDPRTWETQYQLIMALGECKCYQSLPFLKQLSCDSFDSTMVKVAIGDAIFRLTPKNNIQEVLNFMKSGDRDLFNGAMRALAMQKIVPNRESMVRIIKFASQLGINDGLRFWVLAAAPGWDNSVILEFVNQSINSNREDVKEAAKLAIERKYKKWSPL